MKNWKPDSWRAKTAKHLPVYENEGKLNEVLKEIAEKLKLKILHRILVIWRI